MRMVHENRGGGKPSAGAATGRRIDQRPFSWQYMQTMMSEQERLRAQARATVLKALAHPTRVYIVDLISREGPHCVCELTRLIGADTSTVSRHLSLLKSAGLLYDRKEGTTVFYDLTCDCISDFMAGLESVLRARHKREQAAFSAVVGSDG